MSNCIFQPTQRASKLQIHGPRVRERKVVFLWRVLVRFEGVNMLAREPTISGALFGRESGILYPVLTQGQVIPTLAAYHSLFCERLLPVFSMGPTENNMKDKSWDMISTPWA